MTGAGDRAAPQSRRQALAAACLGVAIALSGCGLPGDGHARTVDDDTVPYRLLDPSAPAGGTDSGSDGDPTLSPQLFWILDSGRLDPEAVDVSCAEAPSLAARDLLLALSGGPSEDARAGGLSTAIPPESELSLVEVVDGTAEVEISPASEISADRLPAAVGQIVLTLTSAHDVTAVRFVDNDVPVPVPLPGGALIEEPVTAGDYSELVADRYRSPSTLGCAEP
jgi:hypothetical protein